MFTRGKRDQRYDRQLRLWGDHGQSAIENAKVCLINCGATGAEILKNLVLPGVGSFTILDDSCVREEDLGCNFFLTENDLHTPRAKAVTEGLLELNEAVSGNYVIENFADMLENDPDFFLGFNVIVVTDAREGLLLRLSRLVQSSAIALVICISVGAVGYLRVSTSEHVIIESHPDSTRPDLRLDRPPRGLIQIADECALEDLSADQLAHTPWLIIVHIFVQRFIQQYGHFPQNYKEKNILKQMISEAGVELTDRLREREPTLERSFYLESFEEATRALNTAICPTEIPAEVRELLEDERCSDSLMISASLDGMPSVISTPQAPTSPPSWTSFSRQNSDSTPFNLPVPSRTTFWRLVCALKDFIRNEGDGQLPIRGSLPDMTSDSKRYLRLLSVYREQCEWAVQRLAARLTQFPAITTQEIRLFVKNAAFLRVVRTRSLEEEMKLSPARSDDLTLIPTHEDNDALLWYLIFRGASSFLSETGRWPGSVMPYTISFNAKPTTKEPSIGDGYCDQQQSANPRKTISEDHVVECDLPAFRTHLNRVLRSFGIAPNRVSLDYVNEMCRFGGAEVHSVASFMGGFVAQEVIKLITHQFVPVTKPLIYNAITQHVALVDF